MRLTDLLSLSIVPRWSVVPHHGAPQSVADHSFRVVVILHELAERFSIPLCATDYWYALTHDGAESVTGDIPRNYKRDHIISVDRTERAVCPWLRDIERPSPHICDLIKVADTIEAYTWLRRWGVGPHAEVVAGHIRVQLEQCCFGLKLDYTVVARVVIDIELDAGRASVTLGSAFMLVPSPTVPADEGESDADAW